MNISEPILSSAGRYFSALADICSKKRNNYYSVLRCFCQGLASKFDFNDIYNLAGDTVFTSLGLRSISVLAPGPEGRFRIAFSRLNDVGSGGLPRNNEEISDTMISGSSAIVKFFEKNDDIMFRDDLLSSGNDVSSTPAFQLRKEVEYLRGEAFVPVIADNKLELLMVLSGKMSGRKFTTEDISLLNILSDQTSIALRHARLYRDRIESERLASIGVMSAAFAHEIRNPLTSLKTFAQLIQEKYDDAEFRDKFSRIVIDEIERINGLIEALLDFSSKKRTSGHKSFNIVSVLDEAVDYVKSRHEFEKKDIFTERHVPASCIKVPGNPEKLKHAFINIIHNSFQAMNGKGLLGIGITLNGKNVEVSISDTGEGINEENIEKIFEPHVTTKDRGTGLGLVISKKIIEDHRGSIKVESAFSKGSTFTVLLPVADEQVTAAGHT